jgi:hypothetical protein
MSDTPSALALKTFADIFNAAVCPSPCSLLVDLGLADSKLQMVYVHILQHLNWHMSAEMARQLLRMNSTMPTDHEAEYRLRQVLLPVVASGGNRGRGIKPIFLCCSNNWKVRSKQDRRHQQEVLCTGSPATTGGYREGTRNRQSCVVHVSLCW